MNNLRSALAVVFLCGWTTACTTYQYQTVRSIPAIHAQTEIPEEELLNVAIQAFDPGLNIAKASQERNVSPEVRKAESRFIPFQLKQTLQRTGQWGAVWVTPAETNAADVTIQGKIITSNWEELVLDVKVSDAPGRVWLSKVYRAKANESAFSPNPRGNTEPYQNLYNTIANDMLAVRNQLGQQAVRSTRQVAQLKFASALAPTPFNEYLRKTNNGVLTVNRLPARNDPMMARITSIREREYMLLDTLNLHYAKFSQDMAPSYRSWQRASWEEGMAYRDLKRQAMWRKLLGAAAVIGAIAAEASSGTRNSIALREFAIIGGVAAFKSGMDKDTEAEIHADAIQELSSSLQTEVAPLTVDVEGQTRELTGSAEEQYKEWRRLLRQIYTSETGFALDS